MSGALVAKAATCTYTYAPHLMICFLRISFKISFGARVVGEKGRKISVIWSVWFPTNLSFKKRTWLTLADYEMAFQQVRAFTQNHN